MADQKKFTRQELIDKVMDLNISDEELAGYFTVTPEDGQPFSPLIVPKPDLLKDDPLEGALFMNIFNKLARKRRNKRYRRRIRDWDGVRIVAEGDSWFQYPLILKDTIDHLTDLDHFSYAIYGLSAAGDLLSEMIAEDEITAAIERENPDVFLISGGGNDMVGDSRMATMVKKYAANRKPENYPNEKFDTFLDQIEQLYRGLFSRLLANRPHLKIICHGYDNAIPANGPWLGKPLLSQNIKDKELQRKIIAVMIGRFNDCLKKIVSDFKGSVFHVDCRELIGDIGKWHDELHPKNDGYFKVAEKFDQMIQQALSQSVPSASVDLDRATETIASGTKQTGIRLSKVRKLDTREFEELVAARAREITGQYPETLQNRAERKKAEEDISSFFEKIHKESNLLKASFLEKGVERSKAVCRITTDRNYGSGFLVATRDYIMTNNHVIPDKRTAEVSIAEFDYDEDAEQYTVTCRPDLFFITSKELDFTIVACDSGELPADISAIPLMRDSHTVTRGERVNIIQHPQGRTKEVSLHDNKVSYIYDIAIRYTADTEGGSSGSPVFNNNWDLVALHHAGWSHPDGSALNEGIRIASIVEYIISGMEAGTVADGDTLFEHVRRPDNQASADAQPVPKSQKNRESQIDRDLTVNIGKDAGHITINIG